MEHKFIKLKEFNPDQLEIEVATISPALPEHKVWFAGFDPSSSPGRVKPITPPSRVVGRNVIKGLSTAIDWADRGEIRYTTDTAFSAQQLIDLEAKLDAHDHTMNSPGQDAQALLEANLLALEVRANSATLSPDMQLIADIIGKLHK